MYLNESKINSLFFYWILASLVLVFLIIIVGGLTRLTNSGLSIIEWELFKGILPPLTNAAWDQYFEKYKTIPQFKLLNYDMVIEEFKVIFYWEYFHRILARLIGLFFLVPLVFFFFTKINREYFLIINNIYEFFCIANYHLQCYLYLFISFIYAKCLLIIPQ